MSIIIILTRVNLRLNNITLFATCQQLFYKNPKFFADYAYSLLSGCLYRKNRTAAARARRNAYLSKKRDALHSKKTRIRQSHAFYEASYYGKGILSANLRQTRVTMRKGNLRRLPFRLLSISRHSKADAKWTHFYRTLCDIFYPVRPISPYAIHSLRYTFFAIGSSVCCRSRLKNSEKVT